MPSVLVIDDEPRIAQFVSRALTANGLSVASATDGTEGLSLAARRHFDLVVLDLMMPGVSGLGVLRSLMRTHPHQRVLVLSALSDVKDEGPLPGARGGRTTWPSRSRLAELVARVWARLRGSRREGRGRHITRRRADARLASPRSPIAATGPIALTERESALLEYLLSHARRVCTRAHLLAEVWGFAFDPGSNVVDVCVGRLRAKLGRTSSRR